MASKYNSLLLSKFGQSGAAFSFALIELAEANPSIVVLSSDMSTPAGLDKFKKSYPDRFFNVGIAEQNLIGVAAGLASEGWTPIVVAQACFLSMRAFEQVRQYCGYMGYPIIICGIGAGFGLQFMGNTHYSIEDIGVLRTIPNMTVISPADALECCMTLEKAISYRKPVYIRFTDKMSCPVVYKDDFNYEIGVANELREGEDVQLIATGSLVNLALKVADALGQEGFSTSVIDMHTIKPFDGSRINKNAKLIASIEEHNIINGLGAAVADFLPEGYNKARLLRFGVSDKFSEVGEYAYLLEQHGLTVNNVFSTIINELSNK